MRSTVKGELQRSNPFKIERCGRNDCVLCRFWIDIDCRKRGCVYEIKCSDCSRKYRGQTGRSLYERINEHFRDYEEKKDKNALFEHSKKFHSNQNFGVDVKILSKCFGEPTTRMITEAVLINELSEEETLNSKNEWTYVKLPRATIQRM